MEFVGHGFSYGCLRSLAVTDAAEMLEWMHDPDVASCFKADFMSIQKDGAIEFIKESWKDRHSFHFAVDDRRGSYLGTVSLKAINRDDLNAEYAIAMRSEAHGTGAAAEATVDVLKLAFEKVGLRRVYLNVRADNLRAIRFYEKMGFEFEGRSRDALRLADGTFVDLFWFAVLG